MTTKKSSFNFLEAAEREIRYKSLVRTGFFRGKKAVAMGLGIIILAVGGGSPWLWSYKIQADSAQVNSKIAALHDIVGKVNQLESLETEFKKETTLLAARQAESTGPMEVLARLKTLLPVGTSIKRFSFQPDKAVTLGFSVPAPLDVARLWLSLDRSGMFQSVDIQSVSLEDKAQDINLTLKLK